MMSNFSSIANTWIPELPIYEPGKPLGELARDLGLGAVDEIARLASNENALGPSPKAVEAIQEAALNMHRYPDGSSFYLRNRLAKHLDVDVANILPGNGSNELIELLGHVFLGPGTGVVVADRAFVMYRVMAAAFRARSVAVPMRELTHDLDAMLDAIMPDTKLVFVSNPNNPTGTMVDGASLDRFMDRVPSTVAVVLDEAYFELLPVARQPDTLKYVREGRNVFILRTFSKSHGLAGLRVGYAVASSEGIGLMQRVRQPFNVNSIALAAACAALDDDEHVERTRAMVEEGLAYLSAAFERIGFDYVPSVVNFMLVQVGSGRAVYEGLLKRRVIVRPMDAYGLPEHVRVTVGTAAENALLVEGLEALIQEEVITAS